MAFAFRNVSEPSVFFMLSFNFRSAVFSPTSSFLTYLLYTDSRIEGGGSSSTATKLDGDQLT